MSIAFTPSPNYTRGRGGSGVTMVVIHTAECGETTTAAEGVAAYFARANGASAHYTVDVDSITQSVREEDTAWHCGQWESNQRSIGIEHAGYAAQGPAEWADNYSQTMLRLSAQLVAGICLRYGIPIRGLSPAQVRAGEAGIAGHIDVTLGYAIYGGHTDPGGGFPWDQYIQLVAAAAGQGVAPGPAPAPAPAPAPSGIYTIGSSGQKVTDIQNLMNGVGCGPISVDGQYGPQTAGAVACWQRKLNVSADGVWGPATQAATDSLFAWLAAQPATPPPPPPPPASTFDAGLAASLSAAMQTVVRMGSVGDAVKWVQGLCNAKGFNAGAVDGIFGSQTNLAVLAFQRSRGLVADGIVGKMTWAALTK